MNEIFDQESLKETFVILYLKDFPSPHCFGRDSLTADKNYLLISEGTNGNQTPCVSLNVTCVYSLCCKDDFSVHII